MHNIQIVSYNLDHSNKREDISKNIQKFAQDGVKVFCLQEVRAPKNGEEFIGDFILKILGASWEGKFHISLDSKNDYGLGLIWNKEFEADNFVELLLPVLPKLTSFENFFESKILSGDPTPVKRAVLIADFKHPSGEFRLSNAHLDWQGGFPQRLKQLKVLMEHLNQSPKSVEIICGDLNTIGFLGNAKQLNEIQSLLGTGFQNFQPKFVVTTSHHQQLDHIFGKNIKTPVAKVFRLPGSDHYPVMGEFSL